MDKDWLTFCYVSQSLSNNVKRIGQRLANITEFSSYVSQSLSKYVNRIGQRLANIREFSSYVSQSLFNSVYIIGQRLANLAEYCMIMMLYLIIKYQSIDTYFWGEQIRL